MAHVLFLLSHFLFMLKLYAAPTKNRNISDVDESANEIDLADFNLEYGRYLKEIIETLEGDQNFKNQLENADPDDIRNGRIADSLGLVDYKIRSKLDEIKRQELVRMQQAFSHAKGSGMERKRLRVPSHINYRNPYTFDEDDLRKLIAKTSRDLEKYDQERKEEFKKYEMQKEYERRKQLQEMDEAHRQEALRNFQLQQRKHKEHPKVHNPMSENQLEEIWEQDDQMELEDFEAKTFFRMHDLDEDGYWNEAEVKALFVGDLDKLYDPNTADTDMRERMEEMELMREHAFQQTDTNKDNMISFDEFLKYTAEEEYKKDPGWQPLDDKQIFSEQDLQLMEQQQGMLQNESVVINEHVGQSKSPSELNVQSKNENEQPPDPSNPHVQSHPVVKS